MNEEQLRGSCGVLENLAVVATGSEQRTPTTRRGPALVWTQSISARLSKVISPSDHTVPHRRLLPLNAEDIEYCYFPSDDPASLWDCMDRTAAIRRSVESVRSIHGSKPGDCAVWARRL